MSRPDTPNPPEPSDKPDGKPKRLRTILILAVGLGVVVAVVGIIIAAVSGNGRPGTGDCITADDHKVIDCSDPAAAYEVVDEDTEKKRAKLDACEDHPDGIEIADGKSGKTYWQICVVPVQKAG